MELADDDEIPPDTYVVLREARCQHCSARIPRFDGLRIKRSSKVACTRECWEHLTGQVWQPDLDWDSLGGPTLV